MKKSMLSLLALSIAVGFSSCKDDDDDPTPTPSNQSTMTLSVTGLDDLGDDYLYEGWVIVDGSPVSTGTFSVDMDGTPSQTQFSVTTADLAAASTFVLTIEPSPDSDPTPTAVHILGGDFANEGASLTVGHGAALGDDFSAATGGYILATPTDGMMNNENSGIWFLDLSPGPVPILDLPMLPAGWIYEGWAVIDGTPVTTGTFTSVSDFDDADPFSSTMDGPPFPGEDFLVNAPSGLMFPTDLAGGTAVISIEPVPDNSSMPFTLKPLVGAISSSAVDHVLYGMDNNSSGFPSGNVMR